MVKTVSKLVQSVASKVITKGLSVDGSPKVIKATGSSNLKTFSYDSKLKVLTIEFRKNRTYRYFKVPKSVYEGLIKASSRGSFFHTKIATRYSYREV